MDISARAYAFGEIAKFKFQWTFFSVGYTDSHIVSAS